MPEDTGFYIEDVCIPHTCLPVNYTNNFLQFKYFNDDSFMVITGPGNYSVRDLNDAIVAKINYVHNQGEIVASAFIARTNSIGIKLKGTTTVGVRLQLLTDNEFTFPVDRKRSMNGLLKKFTPETFAGSEGTDPVSLTRTSFATST